MNIITTTCLILTQLIPAAEVQYLGRFTVAAGRVTMMMSCSKPGWDAGDLAICSITNGGWHKIICQDYTSPWRKTLLYPVNTGGDSEGTQSMTSGLPIRYGVLGLSIYHTSGWSEATRHRQLDIHVTSLINLESRPRPKSIAFDANGNVKDGGKLADDVADHFRFPDNGVAKIDLDPYQNLVGKPLYHDVLISNAAEFEFHIAQADGSIDCRAESVLPSRRTPNVGRNLVPWDKRYSVPGGIDGPFAVVSHGKARYVVTPAGHVARMVNADGKACDKLTTVYDAAKVLAVLHDADEEKRYAFTATHFFEVAEPFALKPHAVKRFDTSNGAVGLETAFHCARAARGLPPVPFPAAPAK